MILVLTLQDTSAREAHGRSIFFGREELAKVQSSLLTNASVSTTSRLV
jgi:hypothetical protein